MSERNPRRNGEQAGEQPPERRLPTNREQQQRRRREELRAEAGSSQSRDEIEEQIRQDIQSSTDIELDPTEDIKIVKDGEQFRGELTETARERLSENELNELEEEIGESGVLTGLDDSQTSRTVSKQITQQLETEEGVEALQAALQEDGLTLYDWQDADYSPVWFLDNVSEEAIAETDQPRIQTGLQFGIAKEEINEAQQLREENPVEFIQSIDEERVENFDGSVEDALEVNASRRAASEDVEAEIRERVAAETGVDPSQVNAEVDPGSLRGDDGVDFETSLSDRARRDVALGQLASQSDRFDRDDFAGVEETEDGFEAVLSDEAREEQRQDIAEQLEAQTESELGVTAEDVVIQDGAATLSEDAQVDLLDQQTQINIGADDVQRRDGETVLADDALARDIAAQSDTLSPDDVIIDDGEFQREQTQRRVIADDLDEQIGLDIASDDVVVGDEGVQLDASIRQESDALEETGEPVDPSVAAAAPDLFEDLDEQTETDLSASDVDINLEDGEISAELDERIERQELLLQADADDVDPTNIEFEETEDGTTLQINDSDEPVELDIQDQEAVDVSDVFGPDSTGTVPDNADRSVGSGELPVISQVRDAAGQVGSAITEPFAEDDPESFEFDNPANAFNARRRAIPELEESVESEVGEDIDLEQGDVQIIEGDDGEPVATLSEAGEKTLAEETAPLADVPVAGAFTRVGAGLREDELEATDPIAERFEDATPDRDDVFDSVSDAVGATGVTGVTGVGIGQATGTATSVTGTVSSSTAGGVALAAAPAALTTGGFFSGGVDRTRFERQLDSELVVGDGTPQRELDVGGDTQPSELDISESRQRPEIAQPDGVERTAEVDAPRGDVFSGELDIGSQSPETTRRPQDDSVVSDEFPLPGRDLPADPRRDFVSGESEGAIANTSPLQISESREVAEEQEEQVMIREEDLREMPEVDQPGPSVRERIRRDDLFVRDRRFPTGESAVVGEGSATTEGPQERLEVAQQPFAQTDEVGVGDSLFSGPASETLSGVIGGRQLDADAAQSPELSQDTQQTPDLDIRESQGVDVTAEQAIDVQQDTIATPQTLTQTRVGTGTAQTTALEMVGTQTQTPTETAPQQANVTGTPTEPFFEDVSSPSTRRRPRLPGFDSDDEPDDDGGVFEDSDIFSSGIASSEDIFDSNDRQRNNIDLFD